MNRRSFYSSTLAIVVAGLCFAQSTSTVTLTFEGLQDQEEILNYYNGGLGSFGSGPGPNYGITFGSGAQAIISGASGGSGNFSGNPSGNTIAFFLSGGALTMNVANGFSTGFSFYYASVMNPGVITVYDGLNGTGNLLATLNLPTTGDRCNGSIFDYSCWNAKGVSFTGVAKSVNFGGTADDIGFDNITLGSQIPNNLSISTTTLPNGTTGVAYASTTLQASGGKTPYAWSATGLPTGLNVSSTGVLSGTPTQSGTFSIVATVTDASSPVLKATQTYSITIVAGVSITTTSLPAGTPNVAYPATTLTAQGGRPPLSWSGTGLPPGMSLSSGGVLSGTPTQGGTFSVAVTVKDSSTPQSTATQAFSLVIGVATPPVTITTTSLPAGTAGAPYPSTTLQAQGGTPPYAWSASGLPGGLTLSPAGVLSGTPTASGSFNVTLTVTDSANQTVASSPIALTVAVANLQLSCTAVPTGSVNAGSSYSANCTASGGTPAYTFSAASLPSWLTQTIGTGISFAGTVPNPPPASYTFTVSVSDSSTPTKQTASATVSISVTIPPVQGITITSGAGALNQTTLSVTFPQAAPTTYTGTLTLSFAHDPTVTNVPASYIDPAAGFPVTGQGSSLTQNFTVSQGQTQAAIQFGLGTVAGTWTVTLTALNASGASVLPAPAPTYTVPVAPGAPSISSGTVKIVNKSSSGFSIQLTGFATTRDVASATFVFSAASGAQLRGTTVTVPFNGQDQSQWFNTTPGQNAGGTFSLLLPFGYSGDPNALGSVTVTLTNAKGQASTPANGS